MILVTTFWETMISLTMGWIRILVNYTADSSHCACPAAASLSSLFIVALIICIMLPETAPRRGDVAKIDPSIADA